MTRFAHGTWSNEGTKRLYSCTEALKSDSRELLEQERLNTYPSLKTGAALSELRGEQKRPQSLKESLLSLEHLSPSQLPFRSYGNGERGYANGDLECQ